MDEDSLFCHKSKEMRTGSGSATRKANNINKYYLFHPPFLSKNNKPFETTEKGSLQQKKRKLAISIGKIPGYRGALVDYVHECTK